MGVAGDAVRAKARELSERGYVVGMVDELARAADDAVDPLRARLERSERVRRLFQEFIDGVERELRVCPGSVVIARPAE